MTLDRVSNGTRVCTTDCFVRISRAHGIIFCAIYLLVGPARASAAESGFYAGVEIGQSEFDSDTQDDDTQKWILITSTRSWSDASSSAWSAKVGYRLNRFFGIEASYWDLGNFTFDETSVITDLFSPTVTRTDRRAGSGSLKGPAIGVIGSLPLRSWELSVRASMLGARLNLSGPVNSTTVDTRPPSPSTRNSSTSFTQSTNTKELIYGVAVSYTWVSRYKASLGWSAANSIGDQEYFGGMDLRVLSLGLQYNF